ncbi:glycine zipper 2TM domain-containing protein [Noviherbaspirillum galbum]|uniref:Glycine zipper 2TM domain-containing protein n=1 Tax=Noviherbaspirillum galbum TaxID=2709383 RepID=A0A6B3SHI1_9BURK|nr:glycine zipper 2TM domain-containing protein [Noviherbaspirillum galbum]NEX60304.1 glycine zipper 2TM domain-containing protein [Noviherbaspirillum galbum]
MKTKALLAFAATCACMSSAAIAAEWDDYARVVSVSPQLEQVNRPRQECRTEYVAVQHQYPAQRGVGGSIVGGVAGGLLGNQVGNGNGRTAATAAGAIVGAIVGDRMENTAPGGGAVVEQQPVQRCYTVDQWETRNNGYNVTYEYNGRTYSALMPYDPGQRMRVHVAVTPRP